jgi:succinate dehydrogenase/fumarate reductase cytochrome b subunit
MNQTKKSSNKRAVVSVGLFILFILLIISAMMIPEGEVNPQSSSRRVWTTIHAICGMTCMGFVIFHLVYNWKIFRSYFNGKNK